MVNRSLSLIMLVLMVLVIALFGCASDKHNNSSVQNKNYIQEQNDEAVRNQIKINSQIHQQGIDALTK